MSNSTDLLIATLQEWMSVFMHRSMRNFILYTKENNLSMSQIGALLRLHRQGVCGVSDIGDDLGITSAAASQMLDRLVQQDLIARTEDPNDRRAKQIVLTDKGRAVLHEGFRAHQSWLNDLAATLPPGEQTQIAVALRLLIDRARQFEVDETQNS